MSRKIDNTKKRVRRKGSSKSRKKDAKAPKGSKIINYLTKRSILAPIFLKLAKSGMFNSIKSVNNSKFFAGFIMIMLNIGSKYVVIKLSKSQEQYLRNTIGRQLLIFSIAWMGTRDIFTALIITALFYVMTMHLFNEESRFCIIPIELREFTHLLDTNKDGEVSQEEIDQAKDVLEKAKFMEQKKSTLRKNIVQKTRIEQQRKLQEKFGSKLSFL